MLRTVVIVLLMCLVSNAVAASNKSVSKTLMLTIIECESGFRHDAVGDDGVSRGIAQFRKETFYEFAAIAIKQNKWNFKKLGKPEWLNPIQQVYLLEWGIRNGYGHRWTCYRKLKKTEFLKRMG